MEIRPLSFADAKRYVAETHRHHKPPQGHKFSIGLYDGDDLVGVAICGRPVARILDDGLTLEITRLATDGTRNACSMLYGAARRAAVAMGYKRIITYTLDSEGGASLRASGFIQTVGVKGRSWSVPSRPREDNHPLDDKKRWEYIAP